MPTKLPSIFKILALLLCCPPALLAQANVVLSQEPPVRGITTKFLYDGSSRLEYVCKANSLQAPYSWTYAAGGITNIVVSSNVGTVTTGTAHGLEAGHKVTVTGSTQDPDLNAEYVVATVPTSTTFTIATSAVANGTYTTGLVITGSAPRMNRPVWSISKLEYDGAATVPTAQKMVEGTTAKGYVCDNRSAYAYQ